MTSTARNLERDGPTPWVEPFAGMYWRIRTVQTLLGFALMIIFVQGYWLYKLSSEAAAHVYEIRDGETTYVGERFANLAPRASEIRVAAKRFVELFYGLNSSTIHRDMADALNMCSEPLSQRLQEEVAAAMLITNVRKRALRSEVHIDNLEILESTRKYAKVLVSGNVHVYAITQFDGMPEDMRPFSVALTFDVVRRDPERRVSGLELAHVQNVENRDK